MTTGRHRRGRAPGRLAWLRLRAVLAGGLVLGVGSAVTLAAWTDDGYATADLRAGTFAVESSVTGATTGYADHATAAGAAVLTFTAPATALTPGQTVYSSLWVRTAAGSVAGTVTPLTPTFTAASTGLQSYLTYGVRALPAGTACNATAFSSALGTQVVASGTALTAPLSAPAVPLAAGQAAPAQLCFAVTLPTTAGNDAQGRGAVAVWQLTAISV